MCNPRIAYDLDVNPRIAYNLDFNPNIAYDLDFNPRIAYNLDITDKNQRTQNRKAPVSAIPGVGRDTGLKERTKRQAHDIINSPHSEGGPSPPTERFHF